MIELKRDPETREVVAYKDGEKVGGVTTMGDTLKDEAMAKGGFTANGKRVAEIIEELE